MLELDVPSDSVRPDRRVIAGLASPKVFIGDQPVLLLLVLLTTSVLGEFNPTAWLRTFERRGMLVHVSVEVTATSEGFGAASATVLVAA